MKGLIKIIKVEEIKVFNFKGALRGMRNALNSWNNSDSYIDTDNKFVIGSDDTKLAINLIKAGNSHCKFLRQIFISIDITAPLRWWHDFDTYKISTVKNSCSTMHKLGSKLLKQEDFGWYEELNMYQKDYLYNINKLITEWQLSKNENLFIEIRNRLRSDYHQKATWTGNYQNLRNIYFDRKNHKQKEFREFCRILEDLPMSIFIITK